MKIKQIATSYDPNFRNTTPLTTDAFEKLMYEILTPYAETIRKVGVSICILIDRLIRPHIMAKFVANTFNSIYKISPGDALNALNSFNAYITCPDEKILYISAKESGLPDYTYNFFAKLFVQQDLIALREYVRTVRDAAIPLIPSLWEEDA